MPDGMIKILPSVVAERIAAGEVVERPASVVKELVENSLDAKAGRIEVELEAGGRFLIRVTDDGIGMTPEDAVTCFRRHATSKIDRFEDLELIRTYGFRGEALPSIGAVSRVRLLTRFRDMDRGTEVVYEGGRLLRHGEAGAPVGTDVVVRDLFYNVPARRRFLKTDTAERAACVDVVARMALARPETAFHLLADGKTVLALPPADGHRRVLDYFGKSVRGGERIEYESPGVGAVRGFIWHPNVLNRPNRRGILVYVNGRPVDDRLVVDSVTGACRGITPIQRFPQAVVFLDLPGSRVDVNVHPAKSLVKYADEGAIRRLVKAGIARALSEAGVDLTAAMPLAGGEPGKPIDRRPYPSTGRREAYEPDDVPFGEGAGASVLEQMGPLPRSPLPEGQMSFSTEAALPLYEDAPWEVRGQFAETFILVEYADRLLVIDQHAAHERVIYEELARYDGGGFVPSQELLLPPRVELSAADAGRVSEHLELLVKYGFRVETAGASAFRVMSVPEFVEAGEEEKVAVEVMSELARIGDDAPLAQRIHLTRSAIACKAAVKAGERLTREDMLSLVRRLLASPNKSTCPHGRPTTAELSESQVRRWFRRS
jgi:DNA mismatch repair protein MutL